MSVDRPAAAWPAVCAASVALAILASPAARAQQTPSPPAATPKPDEKAPVPAVYDHPLLQQRISLNLKDVNINQAVEELAKVAKVSLVVERPASLALRPVTLAIHEARLRDVMDMLGQLYGYRWRRKGDIFLLTIVPQKQDMDKFAEEAMKTIYDQVLTPDQRATVDAQGYISGKDLTPGQQGIVAGYLQDIMSQVMSSEFSVGRLVLDRANRKFSISAGDDKEEKGGAKP
jgi:hypothetical protein